jgi:hypothetical protein
MRLARLVAVGVVLWGCAATQAAGPPADASSAAPARVGPVTMNIVIPEGCYHVAFDRRAGRLTFKLKDVEYPPDVTGDVAVTISGGPSSKFLRETSVPPARLLVIPVEATALTDYYELSLAVMTTSNHHVTGAVNARCGS